MAVIIISTNLGDITLPSPDTVEEGSLYGISGVQYVGTKSFPSSQDVTDVFDRMSKINSKMTRCGLDSNINSQQGAINTTLQSLSTSLDTDESSIETLQEDIANIKKSLRDNF